MISCHFLHECVDKLLTFNHLGLVDKWPESLSIKELLNPSLWQEAFCRKMGEIPSIWGKTPVKGDPKGVSKGSTEEVAVGETQLHGMTKDLGVAT